MRKLLRFNGSIVCLSLLAVLVSCQQKKEVPYPDNPSDFRIPTSQPLEIPEPVPFQWLDHSERLPEPKTMKFDLDKLPSKPFKVITEKKLLREVTETSLDWDKAKKIPFKLIVEREDLKARHFPLPEPEVLKFIPPTRWDKSNHSLLNLSSAQGFPGKRVVAQIRDNQGNLWLSTEEGIVKYANNEYLLYEIIDLANDEILDFNLDKKGRIIMSTFNSGFMILDPATNIIEEYAMEHGFVRMFVDDKGLIWGGGVQFGTKVINIEEGTISKVDFTGTAMEGGFHANVYQDPSGHLFISNFTGMGIVKPGEKIINVFEGPDLGLAGVFDFTLLESGDLVLNSFQPGIRTLSLTKNLLKYVGPEHGFEGAVTAADVDKFGNLWISYNDGAARYSPGENTLKTITTNAAIAPANGAPSISFMDAEGMYWIGTLSNGFLLYDTQGLDSYIMTTEDGLVNNEVWDITEDRNQMLWFATYGGINIYDPKTEVIRYLEIPESIGSNNQRGLSKLNDSTLLVGSSGGFSIINLNQGTIKAYQIAAPEAPGSGTIVWRALQLDENQILMTSNRGLLSFNPSAGGLNLLQVGDGLQQSTVYDIFQESNGQIWLATIEGASLVDLADQTITTINKELGLVDDQVSVILSTSKNEIALATVRGLSIINPDRSEIVNISEENGLYPDNIYDMIEVDGRLQLGTGDGIVIVDREENSWNFTNYNESEGIEYTDFNQTTAYQSSDGRVWWAASPSLLVNSNDPNTRNNFESTVSFTGIKIMDQNPQFIEPTDDIDTLLKEDQSRSYLKDNNIKWDSVDRFNNMPMGLVLPHHQNSLTFQYYNPTIKGRDDVRYRYLLEGSDKSWSKASSSNTSKTYFNLNPGEYTFKVITAGHNKRWTQPNTFSFMIQPPWWRTWWAYIVYGLFFVGSVFFSTQARSNYLKRKNKTLEEQVNHRTSQLQQSIEDLKSTQEQLVHSEKMASLGELTAGIAHEIQNPLNFVNNFSEVNKELIEDLKEAISKNDQEEVDDLIKDLLDNEDKVNHHGKRAEQIVKSMLQHSRGNEGKKEPTGINALCDEYLRLAYHGFRAKDKSFNADFDLDLDESLGKIQVVPQDMGRVLLNLINNAFQAVSQKAEARLPAGQAGSEDYSPKVTVTTKSVFPSSGGGDQGEVSPLEGGPKGGVRITVSDNGPGIPEHIRDKIFQPFFTTKPTGHGTGLGLSMSYEIITKGHNGQLEVNSEIGKGTEFIIILPISA